ncbi:MAG: lipoyl synthase [Proteobacteria bacterium]|nr:lipoyl synthase [Pseudomonadota bacterium]
MNESIPLPIIAGQKQIGKHKTIRNRANFDTNAPTLRKPDWIRIKLPLGNAVAKLKAKISSNALVTVCEEASCPNLHECYSKGTATFMILGEVCTRRCSFCDVAHGRPLPVDMQEPQNLANTIAEMGLRYVVITSVDRDDLTDGGAQHYVNCIKAVREKCPNLKIEILTPDYRGKGRMDTALDILAQELPDVFNHNLETIPQLYKTVRPGADYQWSLTLLNRFKNNHPEILTKSGIMVGLGETYQQVQATLRDLITHKVDMITIGQYLQPSKHHHSVMYYWTPQQFKDIEEYGYELGFTHIASGPLVRSSYFADQSAHKAGIEK